MAPKKVSIVEPPKEVEEEPPFSPPPESPEEIKARLLAEREAEQRELDNEWKKIPYVDQKDLGPGNYCGMQMTSLLKPWHYGNHPHDFYKASRLSRPTDLAKHYEFGELLKVMKQLKEKYYESWPEVEDYSESQILLFKYMGIIRRHDSQVFELEAWRQREFLKDAMMVQMCKMYEIQKERAKFQKLRKEIRAEQLQCTLRGSLSPHAVRAGLETEEEEEKEEAPGTEFPGGELSEGLPPEAPVLAASGPEAPGSEAGTTSPGRKKAGAPRVRYSLFHHDMARHLRRVVPPSPPEKPLEYSSPVGVHTPAWSKGKAEYTSELVQSVMDLDAWEEKLAGGTRDARGVGGGKKGSVKK